MNDGLWLRAQQPRWLERSDPRLRVLCALVLLAVTLGLSHPLPLMLALTLSLGLVPVVGLSFKVLLKRLLAVEGLMILLLISLPFTVRGETLWQWHGLVLSAEGLERALVVLLRANTMVVGMLTLLGSMEPERLGHALARLGVPDKLVHLFLMTVRYLFVLLDEYRRLRQAMRARAFRPGSNLHTWRTLGWLIGMLLIRSMERASRVLAAMRCRGFQGRFYLIHKGQWQAVDSLHLALFTSLALSLKLLETQL
ncbi:cobalt ECF transporter T component CbiQ [Ferrimonas sediminicola]|uniref:Cobalt ECF transporter T component CbiQ n=1 Tax=Ferrimonas sediminicola TaxID=2569538 RepID=A0A4U1BD01_9GAMM|nr:cobalt ECF transporter T component CbiQ [Ferrimonas sediminicola]TKB48619.1 cobalt ECF transporter T component CbiQ [Ferrimonas sediminicola]